MSLNAAQKSLNFARLALATFIELAGPPAIAGDASVSRNQFVEPEGTSFSLAGTPFFISGVNNHYLTYGTEAEVTRVLDDAVAMHANVVRTFLLPVIGSLDGSVVTIWDWRSNADSSDLGVKGNYLLYWDGEANHMGINDGQNGLQKVDFLIAEAAKRNLKLIVVFLDFWSYTGGAQQMRAWYGSANKDTFFFADSRTLNDYKTWVQHVVQRANTLTGVRYEDDPTILAWELMNEPNARPRALRWEWLADMSAFVKSLDPNHPVSSGAANVADQLADMSIPTIDFGTWHGYPLYYNLSVSQFDDLITRFCGLAASYQKPVLLEEFGYARSNQDQPGAYTRWLDTVTRDRNCAGWLVWRLVSRQDGGKYPVDEHDQFDIHNDGSNVWNVLRAATAEAAAIRDGISRKEGAGHKRMQP
jgi:mannan endo-1,4-beta-mannosidase